MKKEKDYFLNQLTEKIWATEEETFEIAFQQVRCFTGTSPAFLLDFPSGCSSERATKSRSTADLSRPVFDPSSGQRGSRNIRNVSSWPDQPSNRYLSPPPYFRPSIRPQFLLATKPQTYKGDSRAGGSRKHSTRLWLRYAGRNSTTTLFGHPSPSSECCYRWPKLLSSSSSTSDSG